MIHDCLGHVPPLMNQDYAELLTLIGKATSTTPHGDQVLALKRFSWFSIEFGLIEEQDETKVFGAGILSSTGEIPFSLSPDVRRRPFVTDDVIETDYDPSRMQETLFVGAFDALSAAGDRTAGEAIRHPSAVRFELASPSRVRHVSVRTAARLHDMDVAVPVARIKSDGFPAHFAAYGQIIVRRVHEPKCPVRRSERPLPSPCFVLALAAADCGVVLLLPRPVPGGGGAAGDRAGH